MGNACTSGGPADAPDPLVAAAKESRVPDRVVEAALVPLPPITRRLPTVPDDWPSWSLEELTAWARRSLRASPSSSAVGVLFLSEKDGSAVLQLVREAVSARASDADSADLRLVHGRPKFAELMDGA